MNTSHLTSVFLLAALLTACGRSDAPAPAAQTSSQSAAATSLGSDAAKTVATAGFAFADDDAGRWLAANLTPPTEVKLEPIPPVTAPAPRKSPAADNAVFEKLATLPQLAVTVPPHVLASERGAAAHEPPSADLPALQVAAYFAAPPAPLLAAGPLTYVPSVSVDRPLPLAASPKAADERPAPSFDPTLPSLRAFALPIVTAGRAGPVPFQRFTIPSPFGDAPTLPSLSAGADLDAPVASIQSRPPAPTLK